MARKTGTVKKAMRSKRAPKVSKTIKRYVKKAIHVDKEKKCAIDAGKLASQEVNTTGQLYELLDFISQGDTDETREGNDIRVSHVQTVIQATSGYAGITAARFILCWSPTALSTTDFPTLFRDPVNPSVLQHGQIMYDRRFFFDSNAPAVSTGYYPYERVIVINKSLKGRKVTYNDAASTIDKGHLYLYIVGTGAPTDGVDFNGVTRIRFTE